MTVVIGVPANADPAETRTPIVPDVVKKLDALGVQLVVERGATQGAFLLEDDLAVTWVDSTAEVISAAQIVWTIGNLTPEAEAQLRPGQILMGLLAPYSSAEHASRLAQQGVTAFAMELLPRISRAQSMDILSSQGAASGYQCALIGATRSPKFFPMLTYAAGTIRPARVLVVGAGVAGLQAIATAKRLGAIVEGYDVRPETREQVESLGAKFIDVPYETDEERECAQGVGGYARPMPQSWLDRQKAEVAKRVAQADVVISTALIPGRPAPTLVTEDMVRSMKPGSVIVDIAAGRGPVGPHGQPGGNCPLTVPDQIVTAHGVTIVGHTNLPAMVAADASALYARNVLDFLKLVLPKDATAVQVPLDDDIVAACLMAQGGEVKRRA